MVNKAVLTIFLTTVFIVLSAFASAEASTFYVPDDYSTIQAAVDAASSGDTIIVEYGTYYENLVIGNSQSNLTIQGSDANSTIIDGNQNGRVVYLNGVSNVIIEGFTIQNGYVQVDGDDVDGGGGICCKSSEAITITRCMISNNSVEPGVNTRGGGVWFEDSTGTLSKCVVINNSITGNGGGVCGSGSYNLAVTDCVIANNVADRPSHGSRGGGLLSVSGSVTNCIITGNIAGWQGGGADNCAGSFVNCIISDNFAGYFGGGLHSPGPVTNCTIVNNIASVDDGGGILSLNPTTITNCIIWGNEAGRNGDQVYGSGAMVSYCDVQGGYTGTGNINSDPLFLNYTGGNYHLTENSPCIDAGDPNGDYTGQTDIDSEPRVINGRVDIGADEYSDQLQSWSFGSDFQYNLDDTPSTVEGTGQLRGTATLSGTNLSIEGEIIFNGLMPSEFPEVYLITTDGPDKELTQQMLNPSYFSYSEMDSGTYQFSGTIPDVITPIDNGHYEAYILIPHDGGKYHLFVNTDSLIYKYYYPLLKSNVKLSIPIYAPISQKAHEGTTLTYIIKVKNEGDTEDIINLSVSNQSISEDQAKWWNVQFTSSSVKLLPGESIDVPVKITIKEKGENKITIRGKSSNVDTLPSDIIVKAASITWDATLFGVELNFAANPYGEHTLVFRGPPCAKVSSFGRLVYMVFDPEQPGDLDNTYLNIKDEVNGNIVEDINLPIKFEQHADEVHMTGFDLSMDSYGFVNPAKGYFSEQYDKGYCYGMAETSILYFEGLLPTPYNKQTYELSQEQEETMKNVALYQGRLKNPLNSFSINTEDDTEDYSCLESNISNGHPVIIILGDRTQQGKGKHAVVAYKVTKDFNSNRSYISIYDPTFPYKSRELLSAFSIIVYNANIEAFFPYCDGHHHYTMFDVLEADTLNMAERFGSTALGHVMEATTVAEDWVTDKVTFVRDKILMIIKCPVTIEVVDEYNRIINTETLNEIPGAYFKLSGEEKIFYLPSHLTYSLQIEAYDSGNFSLGAAFPVENWGVSGITFDPVSIGPNSISEFSIFSGTPDGSLMIDFDGDGIFEQVAPGETLETYQTKITYEGDTEGYHSMAIELRATLTGGNGWPLMNETITFSLGTQVVQAITDANGIATATLLINQDLGRCAIDVQFAGNNHYLPSSITEILGIFPLADFNRDWAIDFLDLVKFANQWLANCSSPSWCQGTDINNDGSVDFIDFTIIAENWLWEKIYTDFNMDWGMDFIDYAIFASHWGDTDCKQPDWCSGIDLNRSGEVDICDLEIFTEHWLEDAGPEIHP